MLNYASHDTGEDKTEWQTVWRITALVLTLDKVKKNDSQHKYIVCIFKITELPRVLSLVNGCD